jgi:HYR domain
VIGIVGLGRVRRLFVMVGVVFAALPVGSALAVPSTTIGQTGGNETCSLPGFVLGDTNYVVPSGGGMITSFSFQSTAANADEQLDFMVLQPVSGTAYKVVGKTGLKTLQGTGLETFSPPSNISVQAGEILGFWIASSQLQNCDRGVASGGGAIRTFSPVSDPNVGGSVNLNVSSNGSLDLNESANLGPDSDLALTGIPSDQTVNATGPGGAVVNYTPPTATDEGGETPTVVCVPGSGSLFAIGTTTVTCTVTDADDSNSPVHASFKVTVNGALAQLQDPLLPDVKAIPASLGRLILVNAINDMINNLQNGHTTQVCSDLTFMGLVVQEWSGALMTTAQADTIIGDINQISAVLGCNAGPT